MIRYVARDVKGALRKKYSLYYIIGMLILCILANLSMICFRTIYGMNDGSFGQNLIIFAEGVFAIPYYSTIVIADIIFGKDYPDPHIKDGTTRRLHRWQIVLGKLVGSIILGAIFFVAAVVIFFSVTLLFQFQDGTIDWWTLGDFLEKAVVAMPLWVAGLSIGNMFLFLFDNKKNAFIWFYVLVLAIPRVIMFIAAEPFKNPVCTFISDKILITPQFNALQFYFTMDQGHDIVLGIVYTAISCAIGMAAYYKRK